MKYELLYQHAFAVAKICLLPGESIRAETGVMMSMSPSISISARFFGGIEKAVGRMLGGQSALQSTYTAGDFPGELLLAPPTPGDITAIPLSGCPILVTSGCYLAADTSLNIKTVSKFRNIFASEKIFMLKVEGTGDLLVASFGAIQRIDLLPGQPYIVNNGHIVAFTEMEYTITKATMSILNSITSRERLVARFTGPGTIYVQTRTATAFAESIGSFLPGKRRFTR